MHFSDISLSVYNFDCYTFPGFQKLNLRMQYLVDLSVGNAERRQFRRHSISIMRSNTETVFRRDGGHLVQGQPRPQRGQREGADGLSAEGGLQSSGRCEHLYQAGTQLDILPSITQPDTQPARPSTH